MAVCLNLTVTYKTVIDCRFASVQTTTEDLHSVISYFFQNLQRTHCRMAVIKLIILSAAVVFITFKGAYAQTQCLPMLGLLSEVKLEANLEYDICMNASIVLTDEAVDAIEMLFLSGQTIPSSCNASLFEDVDCKQKGMGKGTKGKKGKGTKGTKGTKGNKGTKTVLKFDVLIDCGSDPCIEITGDGRMQLKSLSDALSDIFRMNPFKKPKFERNVSLLSGVQFKAKVKFRRNVRAFCNGMRVRDPKGRRFELCGEFSQ